MHVGRIGPNLMIFWGAADVQQVVGDRGPSEADVRREWTPEQLCQRWF